jgi:ABC-type branched-subunit amino acid transport system substrate-binding protein
MAGAPGSAGDVFALDKKTNTFKVDDCEITVIVADDQGNPETTATVAREMIEV